MTTGTGSAREVFGAFLKLGLTSFGGPTAHLGYFRTAFVADRRWLDEKTYADIVALCQFLPGPASSQVGMAIGLSRAGYAGAAAAWTAFTLPSALILFIFALGITAVPDLSAGGWLRGLKVVAVAVVAQALLGMARALCPDRIRASLAVAAATTLLLAPSVLAQLSVIAAGAVFGLLMLKEEPTNASETAYRIDVSRRTALAALGTFAGLLVILPILAQATGWMTLALIDSFYRTGSLVFGGGHVVLPLLEAQTVAPGWVSADAFVAGYGAAQGIPGPLFTFSAYLGAVANPTGSAFLSALLALIAIFLPSFLLVVGTLPFWTALRAQPNARAALNGVNAAVVGLLLAAFYDPVWTSGIAGPADFALAAIAFLALVMWAVPAWAVVIGSSALAALVTGLGY